MIRLALLTCLALLAGCKARTPPPDPGARVVVRLRVLGHDGTPPTATVRADDRAPVSLHPAAGEGLDGVLPLPPGDHRLRVESLGPGGRTLPSVSLPVRLAPGASAQLALSVAAVGQPELFVRAVTASASSATVGEAVALEAIPGSAAVSLSWSTEPAGCGQLEQSAARTTSLIARAAGLCVVVLTASADGRTERRTLEVAIRGVSRSVVFPLRAAPNGRYLEDQRGVPFLIKGESAWLALANLTEAEQEAYLADRARKGFNLVEVMLTNHDYTGAPNPVPPANRRGEQPFLRPGDFSTPSDAYFDRAVAFVDRAAAHGIAVLLAPSYLGFDGGREGWWEALTSEVNGGEACFRFGQYLGRRFRDRSNLLWLAGGDFAPPRGSEGERRHLGDPPGYPGSRRASALDRSLEPGPPGWNLHRPGALRVGHAAQRRVSVRERLEVREPGFRHPSAPPGLPAREHLRARAPGQQHPAVPEGMVVDDALWWLWRAVEQPLLWMCESSRGTYRASYGDVDGSVSSWAGELESPGTQQMLQLHAFFESLPWERLVPAGPGSGRRELVTSGQDSGQGHIAAAATPEDLVVAYVPPTGRPGRRFALDLSGLHAPAIARFYDPAAGAFVHAVAVRQPTREVEFQTPGLNASGFDDWALVVQRAAPGR